jgi:hypothetical protein
MSSGAWHYCMPSVRANRPGVRDFALPATPLPSERKSKERAFATVQVPGERQIALNLKDSFQMFPEAASFGRKKDLDSRLVGVIALAALLWVLSDLGA